MGASRRRCGNAGTGPLLAHAAVAFVLLLLTAGTANAFDDPDLAAALAAATAAAAGEDNVATATVAREDKSGVLEEDVSNSLLTANILATALTVGQNDDKDGVDSTAATACTACTAAGADTDTFESASGSAEHVLGDDLVDIDSGGSGNGDIETEEVFDAMLTAGSDTLPPHADPGSSLGQAGSPDLDSVTLGVSSVNPQAGAVRPEHEGIARSNQGSEENDAQSSSLSSSNKGMISGDASVVTSRPSDESVEHSTNERVAFETANVVRADGNNHKMGEPHDRAGSESMRLKDETREDTLSAGQERKDLDGELLSDKGIQQIETTEGEGRGSGKKHEGGMTEEAGQSEPAGLPGAVEGDKGLTFHLESTTMMEDAVVDETEDSISESVAAAAAVVDTATSGMVRVIHYISESRDVVEDGKEETVTLKAADVAEVKRPLDNDSPAAKAAGSSVDDYQLNGEKAAKEEVVIDAKLVSVARISDSSVDSLALAGERNMAAGVVGDALQPARNAGQKHQQQPQSLTQTVLDHEGEGNKSKNDSEPLSSSDLDREHTNQATGDRAGDPGNFESKQQVLLHGNDPRSAATATDIDHIAAHASENARTVVEKPALDGSADPRSYTKNEERQEHQVPTAVPGVGSDGVSRRGWGGVRGTSRVGAEGGSKSASSPDDIAQRVREMEEEILRKLLAEEDAKSLLDM